MFTFPFVMVGREGGEGRGHGQMILSVEREKCREHSPVVGCVSINLQLKKKPLRPLRKIWVSSGFLSVTS